MSGLDLELLLYQLPLLPGVKPYKQKLRKMHPQIALLIKAELQKLLDVGFIIPIDYVEWISNLVPIAKSNGGICIYIDFGDLNKVCPKDYISLPYMT